MTRKIGYIVGSVSTQSINRKLVDGLIDLAGRTGVRADGDTDGGADANGTPRLRFTEIPIAHLAIYNYDHDDDYPPEAEALKAALRESDGLLIVTPEYNRSIPGALKNALDWASRPYGDNALAGIPVGIIGASPGGPGTAMAQQHLRNILAYLDAPCLGQPEALIQFTDDRFASDGMVKDDETEAFLTDWLTEFAQWVDRLAR